MVTVELIFNVCYDSDSSNVGLICVMNFHVLHTHRQYISNCEHSSEPTVTIVLELIIIDFTNMWNIRL